MPVARHAIPTSLNLFRKTGHVRGRNVSDFIPENLARAYARADSVSSKGDGGVTAGCPSEDHFQAELYLPRGRHGPGDATGTGQRSLAFAGRREHGSAANTVRSGVAKLV